MTITTKRLVPLLLSMALSTPVFAQQSNVDVEHEEAIRDLMELTGALNIGMQFAEVIIGQITQSLQQANPDAPQDAFTIIRNEVTAVINEEFEAGNLEQLIIPIYAKYFTVDDIRVLLDFYNTPVGQKTLAVMPMLTQESMQAGQSWGISLGPIIGERVSSRLLEAGISID